MSGDWRASSVFAVGGRHQLDGATPFQDAVRVQRLPSGEVILAVADGHGSPGYDRADEGARLAVEVATQAMARLAEAVRGGNEALNGGAEVGRWMVRRWRERVRLHAEATYRWEDHLAALDLGESAGSPGEGPVSGAFGTVSSMPERDLHRRYGTTLLAALVMGERVWVFQLGDGAVVYVDGDRAVRLFKGPPKLDTATASLALDDAAAHIRTEHLRLTEGRWLALMTDGICDQWEAELTSQWGLRPAALIDERGWAVALEQLAKEPVLHAWGDGDDATVAFAWRPRCIASAVSALPAVECAPVAVEEPPAAVDEYSMESKESPSELVAGGREEEQA